MKGPFTANDGPQGTYPEFVGIGMRTQLLGSVPSYSTRQNESQVSLKFQNSQDEVEYEFKLDYKLNHVNKISANITVVETFYNRLKKKEAEALGIDYDLFTLKPPPPVESLNLTIEAKAAAPIDAYNNFNYDNYKSTHSYQSLLFGSFLEEQLGSTIDTNGELINCFDNLNQTALNFTKQAILTLPDGGVPTGFKFGYEGAEPISFADLWYVNPDSDPNNKRTWYYSHLPRDRVLGKSATENPRVHFLDPALHGGSYLFPKIYIEPATYNGWMGMIKTFLPEVEECGDRDNGFLNVTQIAKRVKEVQNNLPFDERLSLAPDCKIEVPYDKHFSPATHGIMEGIVLSTLKVYGTEFILKTLPVFSGVEFSSTNVDDTFLEMLIDKLQLGLGAQTNRINIVQGYVYYLLFLEQAVQVAQRQIQDGLLEETPEIKRAKGIINEAQMAYNPLKIDLANLRDFDWSVIGETVRGAAIISFGADWEEDFARVMSKEVVEELAKLIAGTTLVPGGALLYLLTKLSFLTPFKLRLCRKINTIQQTQAAAEVYLKALMGEEINELMKKINANMRPRPHIQDIKKYVLSRNGMVLGSSLRAGESIVEQPTVEGATGFDYGDIFNVVRDVNTENPLGEFELIVGQGNLSLPPGYSDIKEYLQDGAPLRNPRQIPQFLLSKIKNMITLFQNGFFYLEKYIRVIEKDGTEQVYNIKEFQERIASDTNLDPESFISENFGNAFVVEEKLGGSIGVKFGTRLIYCPPPSFEYDIPTTSQQERTYQFASPDVVVKFDKSFYEIIDQLPEVLKSKVQNILEKMKISEPSLARAIPVAVYEQDIEDRKISEINLEDKNLGESLKCYIDKLVETDEYKVLFDICFPVRTYTSLFGVYSYHGFFESIAKDPDLLDEDPGRLREKWKRKVFDQTKNELRVIFNATYRTDDDEEQERATRSKKEKSEFMKNLLPKAFLNLDFSIQWWQSLRIIDIKPFDADGNECLNVFQKIFR